MDMIVLRNVIGDELRRRLKIRAEPCEIFPELLRCPWATFLKSSGVKKRLRLN